MKGLPDIDIIGAGNLAWSLAPALENAGFTINYVYNRTPKRAKQLARHLYQAEPKNNLDFTASKSSIFLVMVSDDALPEVAKELILPLDAIVIHTSGSRPLNVLAYTATPNIGVFYPLQTFSSQKLIDFKNIPILVESDNRFTREILMKLARSLSKKVLKTSSLQRRKVHLAAVFASNFTNNLLSIAEALLEQADLDFDILKPLIIETISKGLEIGPQLAQTGPAVRGDMLILEDHLEMLADDSELQSIYQLISQHILDQNLK